MIPQTHADESNPEDASQACKHKKHASKFKPPKPEAPNPPVDAGNLAAPYIPSALGISVMLHPV